MANLSSFLAREEPIPWRKKGLLFEPGVDDFTHGSHPCAIHIEENRFVIAFTRRDGKQRSHIFLSDAVVSEGRLELQGKPNLALRPGASGYFDCDGVISASFVKHGEEIYLYYVGWQNLPEGLWSVDTGRATLDIAKLELSRDFQGPVLGRDKNNPLFAAATAFHVSGNLWQTWYNSGLRWEKTELGWKHFYGIHYAHSENGVDWTSEPGMSVPFADDFEYAFGRPTVIRNDNRFFMWYAHRATKSIQTYRIGFASSTDGRHWDRYDHLSGIDVAVSGWDSEMICYPSVFEHEGRLFMLYNGNDYGKTGFGWAVMEDTE